MNRTHALVTVAAAAGIILAACGTEADAGAPATAGHYVFRGTTLSLDPELIDADLREEIDFISACSQKCFGDQWELNVCPPFCESLISRGGGLEGDSGDPPNGEDYDDTERGSEGDGQGTDHTGSSSSSGSSSSGSSSSSSGSGSGSGASSGGSGGSGGGVGNPGGGW